MIENIFLFKEFATLDVFLIENNLDKCFLSTLIKCGLPLLFYGGKTYLCIIDYEKCIEGHYLKNNVLYSFPYTLSQYYGNRYNTKIFDKEFEEFKEGKKILTYKERIDFDCKIENERQKKYT